MNSNTTRVGDQTEGLILAALIKRGYGVSIPFGTQYYDLIVDRLDELYRVQCKSAWSCKGGVEFNSSRVDRHSGKRKLYDGEVDVFVAYTLEYDECYWVPCHAVAKGGITRLRREQAANGQHSGIRWAADFLLG